MSSTYITAKRFGSVAKQRTVDPRMTLYFLRSQWNSHHHAAEAPTNQQRARPLDVHQPEPRRHCGVRVQALHSGS